jgi:hypothetical protein
MCSGNSADHSNQRLYKSADGHRVLDAPAQICLIGARRGLLIGRYARMLRRERSPDWSDERWSCARTGHAIGGQVAALDDGKMAG